MTSQAAAGDAYTGLPIVARLIASRPLSLVMAGERADFDELYDRPVLDEIACEVEKAARRMFARHSIAWRDDRAMWFRLVEGERQTPVAPRPSAE
jgi:hypothetical protein